MSENPTALDLLTRSRSQPVQQRRATLLEAIELADAENDLDLGFRIRKRYITACHNEPDKLMLIAHYGWCLARHDEDPERFPVSLWEYKWVVGAAPDFAGVSRDQLLELGEDLQRRFEAVGASKGPAGVAKCDIACSLGDLETLAVELHAWQNTSKAGRLNDCGTCDITNEVFYLIALGRHQEAIEAGEPVITGGRRCASQPHFAYANLLEATRVVGDDDLGDTLSAAGLELLRNDPDFTKAFGSHLRHFAVTRQLERGLEVLQKIAPLAYGDDGTLFTYYRGARLLLALADAEGRTDLDALHKQIDGQAEALAARFNVRNGNTFFSDKLKADDAELGL